MYTTVAQALAIPDWFLVAAVCVKDVCMLKTGNWVCACVVLAGVAVHGLPAQFWHHLPLR